MTQISDFPDLSIRTLVAISVALLAFKSTPALAEGQSVLERLLNNITSTTDHHRSGSLGSIGAHEPDSRSLAQTTFEPVNVMTCIGGQIVRPNGENVSVYLTKGQTVTSHKNMVRMTLSGTETDTVIIYNELTQEERAYDKGKPRKGLAFAKHDDPEDVMRDALKGQPYVKGTPPKCDIQQNRPGAELIPVFDVNIPDLSHVDLTPKR